MKRCIAVILTLLLLISLVGCDKEQTVRSNQCLQCKGEGITKCAVCAGTGVYGEKKVDCPLCGGVGTIRCLLCGGNTLNNNSGDSADTQELCTTCNGEKQVECNYCDGKGVYSLAGTDVLCMNCGGSKKMNCLGCGGTGYKREFGNNSGNANQGGTGDFEFDIGDAYPSSCTRCGNKGVITCTGCHGTGTLPDTQYTPDFGGTGGGMTGGTVTCKTCGGKKIIDCPNC